MSIFDMHTSKLAMTRNFSEQPAGDAGPAKPLFRRRVPELATVAIEALDKIKITNKVSDEVAGLIRKRCSRAKEKFRA